MNSLVCQVAVTAGVLVGTPVKEFTKVWYWLSEDQEKMMQTEDMALQNEYRMKWIAMMGESREYAAAMEDPRRVNWVHREWVWM